MFKPAGFLKGLASVALQSLSEPFTLLVGAHSEDDSSVHALVFPLHSRLAKMQSFWQCLVGQDRKTRRRRERH
eukprot:4358578-Amphidinium_carterae.1